MTREYFMQEAQLYFLLDQYYIDFPDDKLMRNKENGRSRPCFFAFRDSRYPGILWIVPISSRAEKYRLIEKSKMEKYGKCNTIRFGTVLGREAAFLIQNMCPATEEYLQAYLDKYQNPIRIEEKTAEDVIRNAKEVLGIARRGARVIFPDVFTILRILEARMTEKNE